MEGGNIPSCGKYSLLQDQFRGEFNNSPLFENYSEKYVTTKTRIDFPVFNTSTCVTFAWHVWVMGAYPKGCEGCTPLWRKGKQETLYIL